MMGRITPFFWCQGFSPPSLRCVVSLLNLMTASVFSSHCQCSWRTRTCVGASLSGEPLFCQRCSGAGQFQRTGSPVRMDLSPVGPELSLLAEHPPHTREGSVEEWLRVEFLICGTDWEGFFWLFPHSLEHLEPLAASHCVPLSPRSKGRINYIDTFSKALKPYIKYC